MRVSWPVGCESHRSGHFIRFVSDVLNKAGREREGEGTIFITNIERNFLQVALRHSIVVNLNRHEYDKR